MATLFNITQEQAQKKLRLQFLEPLSKKIASYMKPTARTTSYSKTIALKSNLKNEKDFFIYPNPAQDNCTIECFSSTKFDIAITDVTGKNIFLQKDFSGNKKIECSKFEPGIYFIQVTSENEKIFFEKLIITKQFCAQIIKKLKCF